jgi:hypothetical protein
MCTSPKPCKTVMFNVKRGGQVMLNWNPKKIPGATIGTDASCTGQAFVSAAQMQAILHELPSEPQDRVLVTGTTPYRCPDRWRRSPDLCQVTKQGPRFVDKKINHHTNMVNMGLRLNSVGLKLLKMSEISGTGELPLQVRMTTTNNKATASANTTCTILSGRVQLAKVLKCINERKTTCPQPPGCLAHQ